VHLGNILKLLFNSPEYIFVFLPLVALGYFLLNKLGHVQLAKISLVGASLFFYGYWNPYYLILIIISIAVNFRIGVLLHRAKLESWRAPISAKCILTCGIIFNLGLLAYYKYTDFFIDNINVMLGLELPFLNLLLPLAISFFTFQQIAYLVDCYKFEVYEYDFLSYCLFVSFFPQLIAGPIVHHKEMMPQFFDVKNSSPNAGNIAKGILIFCIGLFKKVVIADTFAVWADAGFDSDQALTFFESWAASLSYTFQLYYDFSGYTDMAIGAALIFNIVLPINFNSPYKALSIQDFWRRWHMTLSRWLKDYLYIPLGGNRKGTYRTYFNLVATFVLGGLWHGAGWTFILWGSLHGLALVTHRLWEGVGIKMPRYLAWACTFLFVNLTWVFFRAETFSDALRILRGMAGLNGIVVSEGFVSMLAGATGLTLALSSAAGDNLIVTKYMLLFIVVFGAIAFSFKNSMEITKDKTDFSLLDSLRVSGSLLLSLLLGIASTSSVFLYFNF
jgi:D-alanyl-lipoteichoic acid acyltransferase DltB (MBOAT superfamily)